MWQVQYFSTPQCLLELNESERRLVLYIYGTAKIFKFYSPHDRHYCYFSFRSERRLLCSLLISGSRTSYINVPFSSKKLATDFTNEASLRVPVLPSLQLRTRLYLSSYLKNSNPMSKRMQLCEHEIPYLNNSGI